MIILIKGTLIGRFDCVNFKKILTQNLWLLVGDSALSYTGCISPLYLYLTELSHQNLISCPRARYRTPHQLRTLGFYFPIYLTV